MKSGITADNITVDKTSLCLEIMSKGDFRVFLFNEGIQNMLTYLGFNSPPF